MTESTGPAAPAECTESREQRKELRRIEDANRPLDSWERYRALNDTLDEAYELVGIANREARFAAILMGPSNFAGSGSSHSEGTEVTEFISFHPRLRRIRDAGSVN